jgi:hypothetical protein
MRSVQGTAFKTPFEDTMVKKLKPKKTGLPEMNPGCCHAGNAQRCSCAAPKTKNLTRRARRPAPSASSIILIAVIETSLIR